jgi:hypothetical protein
MALWLQVRELAGVRRELGERGVPILREPKREPWGLLEMWIVDPDGVRSALWRCRRSIRCAAADAHLRLQHGDDRLACGCWPLRPSGDMAAAPGRWEQGISGGRGAGMACLCGG